MPRKYEVFWRGELVLEIVGEPGPLISKPAPPPRPGERPVIHPFLSAVAYVTEHEGILREVLDRSSSLTAYVDALRRLGYRVVEHES